MAKGLKYLLLILLLGCAPAPHREYPPNPADHFIPKIDTRIKVERCTILCGECPDSIGVGIDVDEEGRPFFIDFHQCKNDSHSICMTDCLKLPLAQIQVLD